jgi:hypothetical protein
MSQPTPIPADEYPIHQTSKSIRWAETSDRNFYDRSYFNAHDRTGEIFLITGLGVYPHLGVIDAYATVRRGDRQWAVRCSDALGSDRMEQRVGPYRVEVLEPLHRIRIVCDGDDHGLGFDLVWEGSFPAIEEPRHVMRTGDRTIIDACRFAQVGTWSGELRVDGETIPVDPARWVGTRDRSWGLRPVGDPEPPGRAADEPIEGFWWLYVPLRFEDYAVIVIAQELPDGYRTLNAASRVRPDGRVEQLGWPRFDIRYRSGTRHPEGALLEMTDPDGKPLTIEVDTLGSVALNVGAGYGGDPDWGHGRWMGRGWVDGAVYDLTDPAIAGRATITVVDHVARATCAGDEGWGLFEHGNFGRHDPSGFSGWDSVAP